MAPSFVHLQIIEIRLTGSNWRNKANSTHEEIIVQAGLWEPFILRPSLAKREVAHDQIHLLKVNLLKSLIYDAETNSVFDPNGV
jgi:hypothetical protein